MNNIVEKIKKLLTLAADKAATEDEAATALRMAQGLMLKHQIDEAQVTAHSPQLAKALHKKHPLQKHELTLAAAAAYLFGCTVLVYDKGKSGYSFYGRPDNCEAASETLLFLCNQVERLYKANLSSGLTKAMRAEYRRTFKWACASRVHTRARDLVNNPQAMAKSIGSTALVVSGHYKNLLAEAEAAMPLAKAMKMSGSYGSGSADGHAAGDHVRLRKEIGA